MRKLFLAGVVVCAAAAPLRAKAQETWVCQSWGPNLMDGDSITRYWRIVAASVPRAEIPGRPDRTWCSLNFAGNNRGLRGNFQSYEILEAPKNGQFRTRPTSVSYRGTQAGPDKLVVKLNWLSARDNRPMSGTETIEIEVVDHSL